MTESTSTGASAPGASPTSVAGRIKQAVTGGSSDDESLPDIDFGGLAKQAKQREDDERDRRRKEDDDAFDASAGKLVLALQRLKGWRMSRSDKDQRMRDATSHVYGKPCSMAGSNQQAPSNPDDRADTTGLPSGSGSGASTTPSTVMVDMQDPDIIWAMQAAKDRKDLPEGARKYVDDVLTKRKKVTPEGDTVSEVRLRDEISILDRRSYAQEAALRRIAAAFDILVPDEMDDPADLADSIIAKHQQSRTDVTAANQRATTAEQQVTTMRTDLEHCEGMMRKHMKDEHGVDMPNRGSQPPGTDDSTDDQQHPGAGGSSQTRVTPPAPASTSRWERFRTGLGSGEGSTSGGK